MNQHKFSRESKYELQSIIFFAYHYTSGIIWLYRKLGIWTDLSNDTDSS